MKNKDQQLLEEAYEQTRFIKEDFASMSKPKIRSTVYPTKSEQKKPSPSRSKEEVARYNYASVTIPAEMFCYMAQHTLDQLVERNSGNDERGVKAIVDRAFQYGPEKFDMLLRLVNSNTKKVILDLVNNDSYLKQQAEKVGFKANKT